MRKISLLLVAAAIASCALTSEKARVTVPGTNLVLVVEQDEKLLTRYHFVVNGVESADGVLGTPRVPLDENVAITESQGLVRLSWGPDGKFGQFVVVDINVCRIVEHSNPASPPPRITGCARHAPAA